MAEDREYRMTTPVVSNPTGQGASIRTQVLEALLSAKDQYVSGERLSQAAGVTRTAVWKHIKALQEIGFCFDSAPKLGYRLTHVPDLLLGPLLTRELPQGAVLGRAVHWLPETHSTNAVAMDLANQGAADGTLVTAWEQQGGRGRRGRNWFSPRGGLWMSFVLQRPLALSRAAELTLLCSVAVRRAVLASCGLSPAIKWPNDLLLDGRKVCGVLAEIRSDGESVQHAVLGIGLNSNIPAESFPPELAEVATSLSAVLQQPIANLPLAAAIVSELEPLYDDLAAGGRGFQAVAQEWRAACSTLGKRVSVQLTKELVTGEAIGIDDHGALRLRLDTGTVIDIHSGDVLF